MIIDRIIVQAIVMRKKIENNERMGRLEVS
jgi:hypothetical protein